MRGKLSTEKLKVSLLSVCLKILRKYLAWTNPESRGKEREPITTHATESSVWVPPISKRYPGQSRLKALLLDPVSTALPNDKSYEDLVTLLKMHYCPEHWASSFLQAKPAGWCVGCRVRIWTRSCWWRQTSSWRRPRRDSTAWKPLHRSRKSWKPLLCWQYTHLTGLALCIWITIIKCDCKFKGATCPSCGKVGHVRAYGKADNRREIIKLELNGKQALHQLVVHCFLHGLMNTMFVIILVFNLAVIVWLALWVMCFAFTEYNRTSRCSYEVTVLQVYLDLNTLEFSAM